MHNAPPLDSAPSTGIPVLDSVLAVGTCSVGLGGAVIAQVVQEPSINYATLALAVVGLVSLWVRMHYGLLRDRLGVEQLQAELKYYKDRERELREAKRNGSGA